MTQSQPTLFMIMADEHLANAVVEQLNQKGVHAVRLIDQLPAGTPDPDVLEFCHQHGYALITLDKRMIGHLTARIANGLDHGVSLSAYRIYREAKGKGIGIIVKLITFYHEAIMGLRTSCQNDAFHPLP